MKQKLEMPIGVKVPGYGILNEYGEFEFLPSQVGSRKGQTKLIKEDVDYTLSSTKNYLIVHMRIARGNVMTIMKSYLRIVDKVLSVMREYEI